MVFEWFYKDSELGVHFVLWDDRIYLKMYSICMGLQGVRSFRGSEEGSAQNSRQNMEVMGGLGCYERR